MKHITLLLLLYVSFSLSISAQETPTVDEIQLMPLPPNNPIDLARRFRGIQPQIETPTAPPDWHIGDTQFFNIVNTTTRSEDPLETHLQAMSEHVLLWVDVRADIPDGLAQQFVDVVDTAIYQQVQDLWGFVEPGGIDNDPRLYIVMVTGLDTAVAGYFADVHTYPRSIAPNSNQHEMIVINLSAYNNSILSENMLTVIAHEYQHVLRHFIDSNEGTWLDEAFSMITEHQLGWDAGRSQIVNFLNEPNIQLHPWVADSYRFPRYGAVFLFLNYFVERFGLDALRQVSNEPLDNWGGFDTVLRDVANISADEFFADWILANYFLDANTGYGYRTLDRDLPSARPIATIVNYPYTIERRLPQYSTDYYTAFNLADADSLTVTVTQAQTAPLIPTTAFDGDYIYYSIPADSTDLTLTRPLNLSDVESATLHFRTWYDLEEFWDYAYVVVSIDEGNTWDILQGTTTRPNNPYNRAYGVGYTGRSFGWVEETIDLNAYVGHDILLRFEVVTDAASVSHGMAIDDLRLDTIGYAESFEEASDEWDTQGWIRTDNRAPQRTWVQVAQQVGTDVTLSRWLADTTDATWTVDLVDDAEWVLIAISPIAPLTLVDTTYILDVHID